MLYLKVQSLLILFAIVLEGCASVHGNSPRVSQTPKTSAVTICDLVSEGLKEGQVARIVATYRADGSHFSYLISGDCGKDAVLDLYDLRPITQETVKQFYDAGQRHCMEKGNPYLCVRDAKIDVNVKIVRDQDGELAAKMLRVHKFEYVDPSQESEVLQ